MKFDEEKAKRILSVLFKNSNVEYNFGQMKYTIDINDSYHKEFYEEQDYNNFMTIILYIVEINIWRLHTINIIINNNELLYQLNNQNITHNDILNIHAEDKKQIIQHIITRINEVNAKGKRVSNLIIEYTDTVNSNQRVIKDLNDLKEMNSSLIGKFNIFKLKSKHLFSFTDNDVTPNRDKKYEDLYDILNILRTSDKDYEKYILNHFIDMKRAIEKGTIYLFDYSKFQGSFTSCDLFFLNKILDIINLILDNTSNIVSSNELLLGKQSKELKEITEELESSNFVTITKKLNTYNLSNIETYDFKDITYDDIKPDNTLKYILSMYDEFNYTKN